MGCDMRFIAVVYALVFGIIVLLENSSGPNNVGYETHYNTGELHEDP